MVQSQTVVKVADNSGAKYFKIITVLGGTKKRFGHLGDKVSGVVRTALSSGVVSDHQKAHAVIVRTKKEYKRKDGSHIKFDDNAVVLIDTKTGDPLGTSVFGPVAREVKDQGYNRIASLAPEVI